MWSLYFSFVVALVAGIWAIYHNGVLENTQFGVHKSVEQLELIFGLSWIFLILAIFIMNRMKLVTIIDKNGIRFGFDSGMGNKPIGRVISLLVGLRYWNFNRGSAQRFVSKDLIIRYEIRRYKAITEYGGRGYRKRVGKLLNKRNPDIAYTVNGKHGLQLFLAGGQKILVGTNKPESVKRAMKKLMEEGGTGDG